MQFRGLHITFILSLMLCFPLVASSAEFKDVTNCQRAFARAGANFATKTIKANLKCSNAHAICYVECAFGIYGPCDPNDPSSNPAYQSCEQKADQECAKQETKVQQAEYAKQWRIVKSCKNLTTEELCGDPLGEPYGLHFGVLSEGCRALNPAYECSIWGLIDCVGGIREQQLAEQIGELLDPLGTSLRDRAKKSSELSTDSQAAAEMCTEENGE